jgi:hypothetical protein
LPLQELNLLKSIDHKLDGDYGKQKPHKTGYDSGTAYTEKLTYPLAKIKDKIDNHTCSHDGDD